MQVKGVREVRLGRVFASGKPFNYKREAGEPGLFPRQINNARRLPTQTMLQQYYLRVTP